MRGDEAAGCPLIRELCDGSILRAQYECIAAGSYTKEIRQQFFHLDCGLTLSSSNDHTTQASISFSRSASVIAYPFTSLLKKNHTL